VVLLASQYGREIGIDDYVASVVNWSNEPTNLVRLRGWSAGVNEFLEEPLWGRGIGTASTRLQDQRAALGTRWLQTESAFLSMGVEGGLFLLGGFLLTLVGLVRSLVVALSRGGADQGKSRSALAAALLAAGVVEMLINPILDFRTATVAIWISIGIACVAVEARSYGPSPFEVPLQDLEGRRGA